MAQNISYLEFEQSYIKQSPMAQIVKTKVELEAVKILTGIKTGTEEKDLKEWNKLISSLKNKKINFGGK
jgi:hypothetical protein